MVNVRAPIIASTNSAEGLSTAGFAMACVHLITYLSRCTTRACSTDLVRPTHLPGRVHRSLSRYAVVMSRLVTQVGHRVFVAVSRARMWVLQLYAPATGYLFVMATPFLRLLKLTCRHLQSVGAGRGGTLLHPVPSLPAVRWQVAASRGS